MAISVVTFTSGKTNVGQVAFIKYCRRFSPLLIFCPMNIFGLMRFAIFFFATIALTSAAVGPALPATFSHQ